MAFDEQGEERLMILSWPALSEGALEELRGNPISRLFGGLGRETTALRLGRRFQSGFAAL